MRNRKPTPPGAITTNAKAPLSIVIEITGQCNLRCRHCTGARTRRAHVTLATVKKIVDDAQRNNVTAIRFTGGEPLLHPDLPQMLAYAKQQKMYVLLNTNATLVTPSWLSIFSRHIDNILVSLQGCDSASDRGLTRTSLPFSKKIRNILLLRDTVPVVRLGTVITRPLLENFPRYAALIAKIRPHAWELFRPMSPSARRAARLSAKGYRALAAKLLELSQGGLNVKLANALPFCILPDLKVASTIMLGALSDDGHSRLVWDARGFYKPSYFIDEDLGTSIKEAWDHPFLKKLRDPSFLPARCRACTALEQCRGGSRAMARAVNGSYFTADPLFQP